MNAQRSIIELSCDMRCGGGRACGILINLYVCPDVCPSIRLSVCQSIGPSVVNVVVEWLLLYWFRCFVCLLFKWQTGAPNAENRWNAATLRSTPLHCDASRMLEGAFFKATRCLSIMLVNKMSSHYEFFIRLLETVTIWFYLRFANTLWVGGGLLPETHKTTKNTFAIETWQWIFMRCLFLCGLQVTLRLLKFKMLNA